jgi:hypothetical protein
MRISYSLSLVAALSACHLLPGGKGKATSSPSPSASPAGESSSSAPSAKPQDRGRLEAKIAGWLANEARFSAAAVQGKPSLCAPTRAARTPLAVWAFDEHTSGEVVRRLTCFAVADDQLAYSYPEMRQVHDQHIPETMVDDLPRQEGYKIVKRGKFLWGVDLADPLTVVRIPLAPGDEKLSLEQAFTKLDGNYDGAEVDVLAADRAAASQVDLAAARTRALAKLVEESKPFAKRAAEKAAKAKAKLEKTYFPRATGTDADVVQAIKTHLKHSKDKTGIDPDKVKKIHLTGFKWTPRYHDGDVKKMYPAAKVNEATVGFELDDGSCAFVTFEVEREFLGPPSEYAKMAAANGRMSPRTPILCERLK